MKNKCIYTLSVIGCLLMGQSFASNLDNKLTIEELLKDSNTALSRLELFSKEYPEDAKILCKKVMDPESKFLDKAKEAKMPNLKALSIMRHCDNYKEESLSFRGVNQKPKLENKIEFPKLNPIMQGKKEELKSQYPVLNPVNRENKEENKFQFYKLKPVQQTEKKIEENKPEFPKLKPVVIKKEINLMNFTSASQEITEIKENMLENVKKLEESNIKQKMQLEKIKGEIVQTQQFIEMANEHYNNLAIAVNIIREDMKNVNGFQIFKPFNHEADTNEEYLKAFNEEFPQESNKGWILNKESLEQIQLANNLLLVAKENLEQANKRLLGLNEEMLKLN